MKTNRIEDVNMTYRSKAWEDFEKSDYAKKIVANLKKEAEQADSEKHPNPNSEPGSLESSSWQSGTGDVPLNPEGAGAGSSGTPIKLHNLNETQSPIHDVATKAPTGRLAKVLVRMTKIAEAWENSGDERLQPYVQELDDIINTAMEENATPAIQAALGFKKKVTKAQLGESVFGFFCDGTQDHTFVTAPSQEEAVMLLANNADMADYMNSYVSDVPATAEGYADYWRSCAIGKVSFDLWEKALKGMGYSPKQAAHIIQGWQTALQNGEIVTFDQEVLRFHY